MKGRIDRISRTLFYWPLAINYSVVTLFFINFRYRNLVTENYRMDRNVYSIVSPEGIMVALSSIINSEIRGFMVRFRTEYLDFIAKNGVGANDWVSSSPKSYISYLTAISNLLCKDITPEILSTEEDVAIIASTLKGRRNPATIRNYKAAMRQYVQMVKQGNFTSLDL